MRPSDCLIQPWSKWYWAVKGEPAVAPSRTDHFRNRARASTPFRAPDTRSSDAESGQMTIAKIDIQGLSDQEESGDSSSFGEVTAQERWRSSQSLSKDPWALPKLLPLRHHPKSAQKDKIPNPRILATKM